MTPKTREIKERLKKSCSICGKKMKVFVYKDRAYRGGHYFGKIPLHTKTEFKKALKAGTRPMKFGSTLNVQVLKKDPKPYAHTEYWECSTCYWKS